MKRQYVNMLKNMHQAPTEWNFYDEHKHVLKPANDRTATAIAYGLENEQKQLFLHILDLSNLNSSVLLIASGSESSQKHFALAVIMDLTREVKRVPQHLTTQPRKTEHFHEPTKNTYATIQYVGLWREKRIQCCEYSAKKCMRPIWSIQNV
jgi:hypothetical protein